MEPGERYQMPVSGTPWEVLEKELNCLKSNDIDWKHGKAAVFVHYAGEQALAIAKQAYTMYFSENGLGKRAFPSLEKLERDVIDMGLGLLNAPASATGFMTTGGTESIFMAVKAARDRFQTRHGQSRTPEILLARSAHPAFDKAAHFMGLKAIRTPLSSEFCADPAVFERYINHNTAMIVGSAPAYPHGVIDPIDQLATLSEQHNIWMHVDACVGGYFAPFVRMLGVDLTPFDFSVSGVSSISADLHKYGYAAKGASTLFFADPTLARYADYFFDSWPRGTYHTQTLVGTRPGGAIAAAWAVMNFLGIDGYKKVAQQITTCRQSLQDGLRDMGFNIWGDPKLSILAWGNDDQSKVHSVGNSLAANGWLVGYLTEPPGIHLMLNATHPDSLHDYLRDVRTALRSKGTSGPSGTTNEAGLSRGKTDATY